MVSVSLKRQKNLVALSHGTIAGYSVGFDPVDISESAMGLSNDISRTAYNYNLEDSWDKMSHLDSTITVNPHTQMDKNVQSIFYSKESSLLYVTISGI